MSLLIEMLRSSGFLTEDEVLQEAKASHSVFIKRSPDLGQEILVSMIGMDQDEVDEEWGGAGRYTAAALNSIRNRLLALVSYRLSSAIGSRTRKPTVPRGNPAGLYWRGGLTKPIIDGVIRDSFPSSDFTVRQVDDTTWKIHPKKKAEKAAGGDFRPPSDEEWPAWSLRARSMELDSFELKTNKTGSVLAASPDKVTFNRKDFDTDTASGDRDFAREQSFDLSEAMRKFFSRTAGSAEIWKAANVDLQKVGRLDHAQQVKALESRGEALDRLKKRYSAHPKIVNELDKLHVSVKKREGAKRAPLPHTSTLPYPVLRDVIGPELRVYNKRKGGELSDIDKAEAEKRRIERAGEPELVDWGTSVGGKETKTREPAPKKLEVDKIPGKGGSRGTGVWELLGKSSAIGARYDIMVPRRKVEDDRTVAFDFFSKLKFWLDPRGGELTNEVIVAPSNNSRLSDEEDRLESDDKEMRLIAVIRNAEQRIKRLN